MALGRTLILDGLAQNDIDMAFHRLVNLDTSNLPPVGIPPTLVPARTQWVDGWNAETHEWSTSQPHFADLGGLLTGPQMQRIDQLGRVRIGIWQATPLTAPFVPTLDLIRAPAGNVSINGNRLTNVGSPIDPNDAVTIAYMDFLLQGLNPKEAVKCASTGNVTRATLVHPVDGVNLVAGDRILLKDQTNVAENGIWVADTGPWTRSTDCDNHDAASQIDKAYCAVRQGTVNSGTSWLQNLHVTLINTDPKHFILFSSTPTSNIIAGNGLQRVGNTLNVLGTTNRITVASAVDIASNYAGQGSITTLGVVTTGSWNGQVIDSTYGGTGVNNLGHTITLSGADFQVQKTGLAVPDASLVLQVGGGPSIVNVPAFGTLATLTGLETLSGKRITPRVGQVASNANPSINVDQVDVFYITNLSVNIVSMTTNLSGTAVDVQELCIWIKDNNSLSGKSIVWGNAWIASPDLPLPILTSMGVWLFTRFKYNLTRGKWVLIDGLNNIPS